MSDKQLKIVFFGTADFAVPSLKTLNKNHNIVTVVTQPDAPQGRKMELTPSKVKIAAAELGLPILQPEKIRNNLEFIQLINNLEPDFIVVIAYGKIIPKELLEIPKYGAVNLHGSLLPQYRGASPIQQSLLNGDKESGVTFIEMDEGIDTGNIVLMRKMQLEEEDTLPEVTEKLAILGALIFPDLLEDITLELLPSIPQNEERASYCQKIKKEDGRINWEKENADQIKNKLRAFTPWPGCFTFLEGKRVKLLELAPTELGGTLKPGHTFRIGTTKLVVGTMKDNLVIEKLQLEGKKEVSGEEFLKGYQKDVQFES